MKCSTHQLIVFHCFTLPVCNKKNHFYPDLVWNRTLVKSWTLNQHYLNTYPSCQVIPEHTATQWHILLEQPRVHPPACWLRLRRMPVMMKQVHMNSLNQSKRYLSIMLIIMPHNQSTPICICHILKVQKWTGQSKMCYTTDSSSGNLSARIF